jgi:hypothetical protein
MAEQKKVRSVSEAPRARKIVQGAAVGSRRYEFRDRRNL